MIKILLLHIDLKVLMSQVPGKQLHSFGQILISLSSLLCKTLSGFSFLVSLCAKQVPNLLPLSFTGRTRWTLMLSASSFRYSFGSAHFLGHSPSQSVHSSQTQFSGGTRPLRSFSRVRREIIDQSFQKNRFSRLAKTSLKRKKLFHSSKWNLHTIFFKTNVWILTCDKGWFLCIWISFHRWTTNSW